jgi:PilZ domain
LKRLFQNKIIERDSRNHLRKPCKHPLLLVYKYHHIRGVAINISRGGTFIETECKISLGEKIDMIFFQEGKDHKALKLRGWIVRLDSQGVGVSFDRRSERERRYDLDRRTGLDRRIVDKR